MCYDLEEAGNPPLNNAFDQLTVIPLLLDENEISCQRVQFVTCINHIVIGLAALYALIIYLQVMKVTVYIHVKTLNLLCLTFKVQAV